MKKVYEKMLRTNVIKKDYMLLIRNLKSGEKEIITINAESLESAKLRIPDGWQFVEYARSEYSNAERK